VAIHGSLEEVPLPDVLQLLALGKKTGCLSLRDDALQGHIYLDDGRVCDASVINRPDRLGDVLVKRGRITREQLAQAIALQQPESTKTVGQLLVDSGQIPRAEVERLVRGQVEEAVYFLFTWRRGDFTFTRDARPERRDFLVSIDPEGLLLEGARRVDEWSIIQKKIPSFDLTFRLEKDPRAGGSHALTDEQQRLLPYVDGARDVAALVEAAGMTEFDVGKALYGLITAGFLKLVERRARVRHLEQGQLLAYLVREGEFADPARRRQAATHIADCSTCAARLKTIHVRRTQEVPFTGEITAVVTPVVSERTAVTAPATARDRSGWSGSERRTGSDRRKGDQRKGDRRRLQVMTWLAFNAERRGIERRHDERRLTDRREHGGVRPGAAAPATARPVPQRSSGGRARPTGPRRQPGPHPRATPATSQPAAPAAAKAAPESPPSETAVVADAATVETSPPVAKPSPAGAAQKTADISWLVTPDESLELIRASRGVLVPRIPGTGRKPAPTTAVVPPAAPAPIPAPAPLRQPAAARRPAPPEPARAKPATRRWLAAAAAVVVLSGATWLARPLLRGSGAPASDALGGVAPAKPRPLAVRTPPSPAEGPDQVASAPLSDSAIAEPRAEAAPPVTRATTPSLSPPAPGVTRRSIAPPTTPVSRPDTLATPVSRPPEVVARTPADTPSVAVQPPAVAPVPAPAQPKPAETPPASAVETDPELLAGTWVRTNRSEAEAELGRGIVTVPGLPIVSIARPGTAGRSGIRIVQTLESGDPLELVLTRPAFLNRGAAAGGDRVTAVRVAVLEGSGGAASGSARLGGYLINAKARVSADELKALLAHLAEPAP